MPYCKECGVEIKKGESYCGKHKYQRQREYYKQYQKKLRSESSGPKAELIERRCLKCNRKFMAEGKFNRICPNCTVVNANTIDPKVYGGLIQNHHAQSALRKAE